LYISMGWLCLWTAGTNGPIVNSAADIWVYTATVEWFENTEELWEILSHFVHHKSHLNWAGLNPGFRVERPAWVMARPPDLSYCGLEWRPLSVTQTLNTLHNDFLAYIPSVILFVACLK
jgi:hypothetical protein